MPDLTDIRFCARKCQENGEHSIATHGRYCTRCWARLDMPLTQAPEIITHLIGNMLTGSGGGEDRVDSSKDAPVPFNDAAFDDANELYAILVYWVDVWAHALEQEPEPALAGAWRNGRESIIGLPASTTGEEAGRATQAAARWLRNRLDGILATTHTDDIDAFTEQLGDVWRMNARWPRIERPAYSQMPCREDDCGARIAVYPPAFPGDQRRIICDSGHWYPEDDYENALLTYQADRKEHVKSMRTAERLMKKYGIGA